MIRRRQQRVELAGAFQGMELVAAADMDVADEDLRECRTAMRALDHFALQLGLMVASCST
jgi:hypothetical protein